MMQVPCSGYTIHERPVNLTVMLGACELTHIFVCKKKKAVKLMLKYDATAYKV